MENSTLTRYQLVDSLIRVNVVGFIVLWYLNSGQAIFFVATNIGIQNGGPYYLAMAFYPLLVLLGWPLFGVLARAVSGKLAAQPVTSAREFRFLLWPALSAILFVHALIHIGFDAVRAWDLIKESTRCLWA